MGLCRAVFHGICVVTLTSCTTVAPLPGQGDELSESAEALAPRVVTPPPANGKFDYQIGGPYTPDPSVQIVDRDRSESPEPGKYNICYLNAFQTQPDEDDQSNTDPPEGVTQWWVLNHPDLLLHDANGNLVRDPDFTDEVILDVSTDAKRQAIFAIERPWIDACGQKGYQGIEPDNLDSHTRSQRAFGLDANSAYMQLFVPYAHDHGLAVAQKNTTELKANGKNVIGLDFAIAEECQPNTECAQYTNVYGDHVIEIEYNDTSFTNACAARGATISIIRRDRGVVPKGKKNYVYKDC